MTTMTQQQPSHKGGLRTSTSWKDIAAAAKPITPPSKTSSDTRQTRDTTTGRGPRNKRGRSSNARSSSTTSSSPTPSSSSSTPSSSVASSVGIVLPVSRPTKSTTEGTKGKLHSAWTLYYHSPSSSDWTMDSYTKVHTVHSVQSFCELFFWMDQQIHHLHTGMFFLMRDDIMPTWEDPHNRKGGCWSFKVPMHDVGPLWNQLSVRLVGERLSTTPLLLNGISLSPKRGFCIIKVWNHSSTENRASLLRVKDIPKLQNGGEALYTSFREKK